MSNSRYLDNGKSKPVSRIISFFALLSMILTISAFSVNAQVKVDQSSNVSPNAVFTNSTPIVIGTGAANNGLPYPSPIVVAGLSGTIPATPGSIKVTLNNFNHTFPSDLALVLVGPTGAAFLLQDVVGADNPVSGVTYSLSDAGTTLLPDEDPITAGTYKPTAYFFGDSFPAPGPGTTYANPGPASSGTATFASVYGGSNPNGTWNLFVRDYESGDGGSYAGGWSLEINTGTVTPTAQQHIIDYNNDGRTDFVTVRNVGGGAGGQVRWFVGFNGVAGGAAPDWGIASDFFTPEDFDGDNRTDYVVWRPGAAGTAAFYILQTGSNTVRIEPFGQTGDDPTVVGDYDGDGKADPAVYRAGAAAGNPSTWFYRGSLTPANVTFTPWGQNGDFPAPGDYDGDLRNDFVIQRNNGGGQAAFWMRQTTAGLNTIVFGTPTDVIVPGDYDGDGRTDIATIRGISGNIQWQWRNSTDGVINYRNWGASATDFPTQGDYDGDGRTDTAVWRPSATAGQSAFYSLGSTSGPQIAAFGANGDYPVANYNSH